MGTAEQEVAEALGEVLEVVDRLSPNEARGVLKEALIAVEIRGLPHPEMSRRASDEGMERLQSALKEKGRRR